MFLKIYLGAPCIYLSETGLEEKKRTSSDEIYILFSREIKNREEILGCG